MLPYEFGGQPDARAMEGGVEGKAASNFPPPVHGILPPPSEGRGVSGPEPRVTGEVAQGQVSNCNCWRPICSTCPC